MSGQSRMFCNKGSTAQYVDCMWTVRGQHVDSIWAACGQHVDRNNVICDERFIATTHYTSQMLQLSTTNYNKLIFC